MVITSYKFAKSLRPPESLSDKEKKNGRETPSQDGTLQRGPHGLGDKGQKMADKPRSAQPSCAGASEAVLVAEGGCWHCLGAAAPRCQPPQSLVVLRV